MLSPCVMSYPQFQSGQRVMSLVSHPPEVKPGTTGTIVSPWFGTLCAVQLPSGELHRWFASFELAPVNPAAGISGTAPGNYATVVSNVGHPPHIVIGTVVKIVRCMPQTIFYDLMLHGAEYHRWLADFELANPVPMEEFANCR